MPAGLYHARPVPCQNGWRPAGSGPAADRGSERQMGKHVDDGWSRLGGAIRERRLRRSLSLVGLAALAELSQPFLSADRKRPRPALAAVAPTDRRSSRHDATGSVRGAVARAARTHDCACPRRAVDRHRRLRWRWQLPLVAGRRRPGPLDRVRRSPYASFSTCSSTDGYEVIHVVAGVAEVEVDGVVTALAEGDSMAYASRSPHRFRSVGIGVARVLLVEAARDDRRDRGRNDGRDAECTDHAAERSGAHVVTSYRARPSRGPTGWAARSKRRG